MQIEVVNTILSAHVLEHIRWTPRSFVNGYDLNQSMQLQSQGSEQIRGRSVFPYSKAGVQFRLVRPASSEVRPTSFYVLSELVQQQHDLRKAVLEAKNIDLLLLAHGVNARPESDVAGLIVRNADGVLYTVIPPVCEYPIDADYGNPETLLINDGHHRMTNARNADEALTSIVVNGVSVPFYALANPRGWRDCRTVEKVPSVKKAYSEAEPYRLYRNFNHGFVLLDLYPELQKNGVLISAPR